MSAVGSKAEAVRATTLYPLNRYRTPGGKL